MYTRVLNGMYTHSIVTCEVNFTYHRLQTWVLSSWRYRITSLTPSFSSRFMHLSHFYRFWKSSPFACQICFSMAKGKRRGQQRGCQTNGQATAPPTIVATSQFPTPDQASPAGGPLRNRTRNQPFLMATSTLVRNLLHGQASHLAILHKQQAYYSQARNLTTIIHKKQASMTMERMKMLQTATQIEDISGLTQKTQTTNSHFRNVAWAQHQQYWNDWHRS